MLFLPLPFVVTILLLVLFAAVLRRVDGGRVNKPFLALILAGALQSLLAGLRWGYGVWGVAYIAPVLAAVIPPLVYAGVLQLVQRSGVTVGLRDGIHAIPAAIIFALILLWRDAIDIALILVFVGYAVAVLLLIRPGTDALRLVPFEAAATAYRAILFAAFALLWSAAIDGFIFFDFVWARGEHAHIALIIGNLAALLTLSVAVASVGRGRVSVERSTETEKPDPAGDHETIAAVQALMETKRVYRDVDLNLDRLARKLGIPARQVSTAINRATGKNVSQYVNEYRINEACGLLAETQKPVTEVMFDVGFQTKSNFNREFRRVTDMTPVEWRERKLRMTD